MFSMVRQFLSHVLPGVLRPLRTLWNEIIGFLFIALAVWAAPSAYRAYRDYNGDAESIFRVLLTGLFLLLMGSFGISSFLRARRISRS